MLPMSGMFHPWWLSFDQVNELPEKIFKGRYAVELDSILTVYRRRIIEIDKLKEQITIIPFCVWTDRPMSSRYFKLKKITIDLPWHIARTLEDELDVDYILNSGVPEIFSQDINYGCGFKKHYGQIVSLLDKIDIENLFVSAKIKRSLIQLIAK
jgi:hypothetical protein